VGGPYLFSMSHISVTEELCAISESQGSPTGWLVLDSRWPVLDPSPVNTVVLSCLISCQGGVQRG
jgi:hypothetical protein